MPAAREFVTQGRKALAAGDARAAIASLRAALSQDPGDANTLLLLAQALERDGQLPQAQKAWLLVASRLRSPQRALQRAVTLSLQRKDLGATAKLLGGITTNYPRLLGFHADLARLELGRGAAATARQHALQLVDRALAAGDVRRQAEGHLIAGLANLLDSKTTFAEKHLIAARDLAPDDVEPWLALASLRILKKDRLKAEQVLVEAVRRFPKAFGPANNLGLLYLKSRDKQRRKQAIPLLERAALNDPQNKDVFLNLAIAWYPHDRERAAWCARKAMLATRVATRRAAARLLSLASSSPSTRPAPPKQSSPRPH